MSKGRGQTFWYVIGGLLFILSGVFALLGFTFAAALGIILIVAGVAVIAAILSGYVPSLPSFAVFLAGLIFFGAVFSGYAVFVPVEATQVYELTTDEFDVTGLNMSCAASTGNIRLVFTDNETIICKVVFTWSISPWSPRPPIQFQTREMQLADTTEDKHLLIDASTTTANIEITAGSHLESNFTLSTSTGNIHFDAPPKSKVEKLTLRATTGNIEAHFSSPEDLERLQMTTSTGNARLSIEVSSLNKNCTAQVGTTTGNVRLDLNLAGNIGCDLTASTNLGDVETDLQGFTVLEGTERFVHAQTEDYSQALRKIVVTANTNTGNIDVDARK